VGVGVIVAAVVAVDHGNPVRAALVRIARERPVQGNLLQSAREEQFQNVCRGRAPVNGRIGRNGRARHVIYLSRSVEIAVGRNRQGRVKAGCQGGEGGRRAAGGAVQGRGGPHRRLILRVLRIVQPR